MDSAQQLIQSFEAHLMDDLKNHQKKIKVIEEQLENIKKFNEKQRGETTDESDDSPKKSNSVQIVKEEDELYLNNAKQYFMMTDDEDNKLDLIIQLFKCQPIESAVIYCKSISRVETLTTCLTAEGFDVHNMIGKNSKQRKQITEDFNSDSLKTNAIITVRRINSLENVSLFVNYDLPSRQSYMKKIGSPHKSVYKYFVVNIITTKELTRLLSYGKHFNTEILSLPINNRS